MKAPQYIVALLFSALSATGMSQDKINLIDAEPAETYDNIRVEKLSTDERASCFMIWVKDNVRPHYHAKHTENLYVIEGTGTMQVGDHTMEIGPGDYLTIPMGSVHSVTVTSEVPLKVLSVQAPEFLGADRVFVPEGQ